MTMTDTEVSTTKPPIETRSAVVTGVRYPERIVELYAVPYGTYSPVEYPANSGRFIEEGFEPGSFGAVNNRASRFLVALEHDMNQVVGRVHALHPEDSEGLRTELFIRRGSQGDQVLDDCSDQILGGSVGFGAFPANIRWEGRQKRTVLRAFLDHIGLTVMPAHTGTMPIAVRSAPIVVREPIVPVATSSTPNLDKIMAERLAAKHGIS